ncbi:MAG: sigma-70 family RNA polymerase sigma factor [Candidatus Omnitrophota bacterium]
MSKIRTYTNVISILLVCEFLLNTVIPIDIARALSPWVASQNVPAKQEMRAFLDLSRVITAEKGSEEERLLRANSAEALLVSSGKFLVLKEIADDNVRLVRVLVHESVEMCMQILRHNDRYRYNSIKELILGNADIRNSYYGLCHGGKAPEHLDNELMLNDIVAKAIEIIFMKKNGLIKKETESESRFLKTIEPMINENRHNYFTGELYISEEDSRKRDDIIRNALKKGFVFYQATEAGVATAENAMSSTSDSFDKNSAIFENDPVITGDKKDKVIDLSRARERDETPLVQDIKAKIVEWWNTGEGSDVGDSLIMTVNLKKRKTITSKGKMADMQPLLPDAEIELADIIFIAEEDINIGIVLNCYYLGDYSTKEIPRPIKTFAYDPAAGRAHATDPAGFDITRVAYGIKNIISRHLPYRTTMNLNNVIKIKVFNNYDGKYDSLFLSLERKGKYRQKEVVAVVEDDINDHGQVVNVYYEDDFDDGRTNEPLRTWIYDEATKKQSKTGNGLKLVDLGKLDLKKVYEGGKLEKYGRTAFAGISIGHDGGGRVSMSEYGIRLVIHKKYMHEDILNDEACVKAEEDVNRGIVINVYLRSHLSKDQASHPVQSYVYFPDKVRQYKRYGKVITKQGFWEPVELAAMDVNDCINGRRDLKEIKGRRVKLNKESTGKVTLSHKRGGIKSKGFSLSRKDQDVKGETERDVFGQVKEDRDYGAYIEISDGIHTNGYYCVEEKQGLVPIDMDKIAFLDNILGNKNIHDEDTQLREIVLKKKISKYGGMDLNYRGRKLWITRLNSYKGRRTGLKQKDAVLIVKKDDENNWIFHVHEENKYLKNPERTPDIILIRNKYFKTLIPDDRTELFKAIELYEKKQYFQARTILERTAETDTKNMEVKKWLNRSIVSCGEIAEDLDVHNSILSSENKEQFLDRLIDLVAWHSKDEERAVSRFLGKVLHEDAERADSITDNIIERLDLDEDFPEKIQENLAIMRIIALTRPEYITRDNAAQAAGFLNYEGPYKHIIRLTGERFFRAIPDEMVFDMKEFEARKKKKILPYERDTKGIITQYKMKAAVYPFLTAMGEIKLGVLKKLGDEKAREQFINSNLLRVLGSIRNMRVKGVLSQDLLSHGYLGLVRAVDGFDPSFGTRFSTYCQSAFITAMSDYVFKDHSIYTKSRMSHIRMFVKVCHLKNIDPFDRSFSDEAIAEALEITARKVYQARKDLGVINIAELDAPLNGTDADSNDALKIDFIVSSDAIAQTIIEEKEIYSKIRARMHMKLEKIQRTLMMSNKRDNAKRQREDIVESRFMPLIMGEEPDSLNEIGKRYGVSREAIRYKEESLRPIFKAVLDEFDFDMSDIPDRYTPKKGSPAEVKKKTPKIKAEAVLNEVDSSMSDIPRHVREKGSPTEALRVIYKHFGFGAFNRDEELYPLREPYKLSTIKTEARMLRQLNILIMDKGGKIYRLNETLKGETEEETERNIAVVYNIKLKIDRTEEPLDRFEIPSDKMDMVREVVKMELADKYFNRMAQHKQDTGKVRINVWEGYASPAQAGLLTRIECITRTGPYNIKFKELNELVNEACGKKDDMVTILPHDLLGGEARARLEKDQARVLFMDIGNEHVQADEFVQVAGIIGFGIAYLNGDNTAFDRLYRILTGSETGIGITVDELKKDPLLAVKYIFKLISAKIHDYSEIKQLNDRMETLLTSA